jgi:Bacterial TniB protein
MITCSRNTRRTWTSPAETMLEPMDHSESVLVKYPLFKTAVSRIQACFDSYGTTAEPDCCPIVGESGSCKTTIISYFASLHPRVDRKTGVEVPVLIARVPARPSVKSFAETLLYQLGDPLWSRGNTVSQSIRLRELLKQCHVRLLALDEFQHFVDVRRANIPNEVADWLKEQVEEAKLAIVVLGLERCLEVLRQNEQLRRRFGATLRVGAFRWNTKEDHPLGARTPPCRIGAEVINRGISMRHVGQGDA